MIGFLKGVVAFKESPFLVLETNGVGYKVSVTSGLLAVLKQGEMVALFTHLAVRDDALDLYGFLERGELSFFELLLTVPGIGPRSALAILNLASLHELAAAIAAGDSVYLTNVSGVGKKSAAKIIVELKDKVALLAPQKSASVLKEEMGALEALKALGYGAPEAKDALSRIPTESIGTSERVRVALKLLGGGGGRN